MNRQPSATTDPESGLSVVQRTSNVSAIQQPSSELTSAMSNLAMTDNSVSNPVTEQAPQYCRRVWVGECRKCKKTTINTCKVCNMEFYCSNKHAKEDVKSHKKDCAQKLKILQTWRKNRALDLVTEVLAIAAKVFRGEEESSEDQQHCHSDCNETNCNNQQQQSNDKCSDGTWSAIPLKLNVSEEGNRDWYLQIGDPKDSKCTWKEFEKRGFSKEHFDQIECLGKASMYNSSTLLALQELTVRFGSKFVFDTDPVDTFYVCNVSVNDKLPSFCVHYPDPKVENQWKREEINLDKHQVLGFRTDSMGEMFVDFAGPQFGIMQRMVPDVEMPIWLCPFEKQKLFSCKEKIFASEMRSEIEKQVQDTMEKQLKTGAADKLDFYATIVMRYSQIIVERILRTKTRQMNKLYRPSSARQLPVTALPPELLEEYNRKVQNNSLHQEYSPQDIQGCLKHDRNH